MSTHVSIHCIKWIRASAGGTIGAPLTIEISGDGSIPNSITLFTDDQVLSDRLVEVINEVVDTREQEKRVVEAMVANESAAYEALDRMQDPVPMPAIAMKKEVNVEAKTLEIHCKVSDSFTARLVDQHGETIHDQDYGYVPRFMPGQHYGDYVILDIDLDTGKILNWKAPSAEDIQEWIDKGE